MRVAVLAFPGSSFDEWVKGLQSVFGVEAYSVWYSEDDLKKADVVILPGGAAFGDYLRPGALTIGSPSVNAVRRFGQDGGLVLGFGNGFQILCENKILPGILLENRAAKFVNTRMYFRAEGQNTRLTAALSEGDVIQLPFASRFAYYYADKRALIDLEEGNQVLFRYCNKLGELDADEPFIGSSRSIAGISNREGNVIGLMAHPQRLIEELMGGTQGLKLLSPVFTR